MIDATPSPERRRPPAGICCPKCGGSAWKVRRTVPQPGTVRRERTCKGKVGDEPCECVIVTYERPAFVTGAHI
jgi:transposase